jgi:hypothetical protein
MREIRFQVVIQFNSIHKKLIDPLRCSDLEREQESEKKKRVTKMFWRTQGTKTKTHDIDISGYIQIQPRLLVVWYNTGKGG